MITLNKTLLLIFTISFFNSGCKSVIGIQTATALGTTGGEAFGEMFGRASGNAAEGAVIGASMGEVTGSVIGFEMDKQAEEIKKDVSKARVDRAGDGIVVEFNNKILFESNRATLSTDAEKSLDELAMVFKKYPENYLEIHGHTDNKGDENRNLSLSQKRAMSVAAYLETKGIDKSRILTKGLGNASPRYDNNSEQGRLQNRRVEILIKGKK